MDGCGEPYPWASRQDRIYQLENLLDEEQIDEPIRLLVMEDFDVFGPKAIFRIRTSWRSGGESRTGRQGCSEGLP